MHVTCSICVVSQRFLALLIFSVVGMCHTAAETAYFVMSGPARLHSEPIYQSYVVEVTDPVLIEQARAYLRSGVKSPYLVPEGIAIEGQVPYNVNFADGADPPQWPWHVVRVLAWATYNPLGGEPAVFDPELHSAPSDVLELVRARSGESRIQLVNYPLVSEITDVSDDARVVNVSARGFVGSGEQILIAGLIISGTVPRNVVVRGLGPSLQSFGVTTTVDDPKIEVFRGETKIAENDNWEDGNLGDQAQAATRYNWYIPPDPKESAMWLLLAPGAYTIMLTAPSGESGIGVIEAYDATVAKD